MERTRQVEVQQLKKEIPEFEVGDTVEVHVTLVEGERDTPGGSGAQARPRERTQLFTGTVIARKGRGLRETFTVRRIVQGEGVERVFPLHSPFVTQVKVLRQGRTRRAKLYYLRRRVGKATRLRERRRPSRRKPGAGPDASD
jgi:large subunit ribosomal protein L19